MEVFVITADQRQSRRGADLVDGALQLAAATTPEPVLNFERTAGDEFQGVLDDADDTIRLSLALIRQGSWSVGIGAGEADEPLPTSTRAARGTAFIRARNALDTAKRRPYPVAVVGADAADSAADADALLALLAAVIARRTTAGWEALDLMEQGRTLAEAAADLGITRQAVSQRLAVALWQQERDTLPLAGRLLRESR